MLRESRACWTCYEDATRTLATFRPSRHVRMFWRVANMSATSCACRAREIWRTTRQTDKRAEAQAKFSERNSSLWQAKMCR